MQVSLSIGLILKLGYLLPTTLLQFFLSKCIGRVKACIACGQLIKHFPITFNDSAYHKIIH